MDIPGFQIERELATGGNGRICLAWQQNANRWVALKSVAGGDFAGTPSDNRLTGAVAACAELRHRNIAQLYETQVCGSMLVLVIEYVPGGDLKRRLETGIRWTALVDLIQAIGEALDYAHDNGFVHLDIRPENILFRADGSPVLTDFSGGWRIDGSRLPVAFAAAVGAPQYRSPEQLGGGSVDSRSDLYSLGAVLYSILTGDAPRRRDAGIAQDAGQSQERVARLPIQLSALQPVVDRALARNPAQRFQRGADLAAALADAGGAAAFANTTFKSVAVTMDEIQAAGGNPFTVPVDTARENRRERRHRRKTVRRTLLSILLVAATGMGGGYLISTQPLWFNTLLFEIGLAENPLMPTAWTDAQSLHRDPNQSLSAIVAGYRRVLVLDPEHLGAQEAIAGLAEQWRAGIIGSLAQNDIAQAETKLADMLAAFPDDSGLDDLQRQLADRKTAVALLTSTQALLRSHGLSDIPSATAAIQAYNEVMRLAPGHPVAQQELTALAEHYAGLAHAAATRGEVEDAISLLERATAANGELPVLATVRGKIQQATTAQAAIEQLLQQARSYRAGGFLVAPPGENAAELYHRVLATAPDDVLARQGLSEVTSQLLNQAARMLEEDDFSGVGSLLDHASAAGIDADALVEIKTRLDDRIAALATVDSNLREAEALLRQGFVTEPPERNAVSLLRDAERLDPGNPRAQALLAQAGARLVVVAQEAYAAGLEEEAKQYLELALTVTPDIPAWQTLRESWE